MITKGKRLLSLILCGLMLLSGASCSDNGTKDTSDNSVSSGSANTEETAVQYVDDIPEGTTFGGTEIRFVLNRDSSSVYFNEEEQELGDPVDEAVWKRNNLLEDRLEVKIAEPMTINDNSAKFVQQVTNSVTAGSDDYDLVIGHARFNIELLLNNVLFRLDDLNYIDLEKSYWSQGFNDNIAYNGSHFWAVGDISQYYISSTYIMVVNEQVWNNHFQGENIYDIVREGKWTVDELKSRASVAYVDENGDGLQDVGDTYGLATNRGHTFNGMYLAAGVNYTDFDADGTPVIAINSEHTIAVHEKIHDLMYNSDGIIVLSDADADAYGDGMFISNRAMFKIGQLSFLENDNVRNMDTDFYVIPMPKYDETQENYRAGQHDGTPIYGMLNTIAEDRVDAVSASFEAMCSMASTMVIPVYYDDILKNKYSRDPSTAEMIDLIRSCLETEFGLAWSDSMKTSSMFAFMYSNAHRESITSLIEKSEKVWVKDMEKLVEQLDAIAEQFN